MSNPRVAPGGYQDETASWLFFLFPSDCLADTEMMLWQWEQSYSKQQQQKRLKFMQEPLDAVNGACFLV